MIRFGFFRYSRPQFFLKRSYRNKTNQYTSTSHENILSRFINHDYFGMTIVFILLGGCVYSGVSYINSLKREIALGKVRFNLIEKEKIEIKKLKKEIERIRSETDIEKVNRKLEIDRIKEKARLKIDKIRSDIDSEKVNTKMGIDRIKEKARFAEKAAQEKLRCTIAENEEKLRIIITNLILDLKFNGDYEKFQAWLHRMDTPEDK